jgi:hypothetical protein
MSETTDNPAKKKPEPITTIVQLGPGLEGPRGHREIRAVPRGALQVREDGNKLAVLSLEGHTGIYALIGNEPPALLQALGGKGFYYDNELRVTGDALVLIDRVAPRAYRFLDGQVATYSLYVP